MATCYSRLGRVCVLVGLTVLPFSAAMEARAGTISPGNLPTITVGLEDGQTTAPWTYRPSLDLFGPAPDGGWELYDSSEHTILDNRARVEIQKLQFDPDPFVLNNILITNLTGVPQVYTVGVTLPTSFGAPNVLSGTIFTSVIDGGLDGATIATVGGFPLYAAQIDFATVATMQNDPFAVVAGVGGSNGAGESFGPIGGLVPVTANMGIQLRFSLTPGDTAAVLSRFDVVPEPASLGLFTIALATLAGRRRRIRH